MNHITESTTPWHSLVKDCLRYLTPRAPLWGDLPQKSGPPVVETRAPQKAVLVEEIPLPPPSPPQPVVVVGVVAGAVAGHEGVRQHCLKVWPNFPWKETYPQAADRSAASVVMLLESAEDNPFFKQLQEAITKHLTPCALIRLPNLDWMPSPLHDPGVRMVILMQDLLERHNGLRLLIHEREGQRYVGRARLLALPPLATWLHDEERKRALWRYLVGGLK